MAIVVGFIPFSQLLRWFSRNQVYGGSFSASHAGQYWLGALSPKGGSLNEKHVSSGGILVNKTDNWWLVDD